MSSAKEEGGGRGRAADQGILPDSANVRGFLRKDLLSIHQVSRRIRLHFLHSLFKVFWSDAEFFELCLHDIASLVLLYVFPDCQHLSRFANCFDICPRKAVCLCRKLVYVYCSRKRLALEMNLEYLLASFKIWGRHVKKSVEPPGPQKCRVDHVRSVRSPDHDHIPQLLKAIEFRENLTYDSLSYLRIAH